MRIGREVQNDLINYMGDVGVGPRGSKDMTYENARAAMTTILAGDYHPATLGAFLLALRWKGETPDELAGFLDTVRSHAMIPCSVDIPGLVDAAGNYDGKKETLHVSVAASIVAAGAGTPVLMHDGTGIPTKYGVTKAHVLEALGIPTDLRPDAAAECMTQVGLGYLHQRLFNPGLADLLAERCAMGKRTFINTIEPLVNPGNAAVHIGSFFHLPYGERVCRTLARSAAGYQRAIMVQGIEGTDEIRLGRARVVELRDGRVTNYQIDSSELGLKGDMGGLAAAGADPKVSARLTEELLERNEAPEAFRSAVLLSAALRIYAAGRTGAIADGLDQATASLVGGAAGETLRRWRRWTKRRPAESETESVQFANRQRGDGKDPTPPTESAADQSERNDESYIERIGWDGPMQTYPIFLVGLAKRRCVVVGGGRIATDKVRGLLDGGSGRVDVISPDLSPELHNLVDGEHVRHIPRGFSPDDLDGAFLVISATDEAEINRRVYAEAESRGILAQVVDDPPLCTFIMPSIVRRGGLTVAISTGGASPALAARLRSRLERELGLEYERFVALAGEIRPLIMDTVHDPAVRKQLAYDLVDSHILTLLRSGDTGKAHEEAERLIRRARGDGDGE